MIWFLKFRNIFGKKCKNDLILFLNVSQYCSVMTKLMVLSLSFIKRHSVYWTRQKAISYAFKTMTGAGRRGKIKKY